MFESIKYKLRYGVLSLTARQARIDLRGRAVIDEDVGRIGFNAFAKRSNLRFVEIPGHVRELSSRAFADCKNLKQVEFCEGVEILEGCLFNGCHKLKRIILPDSVKEVSSVAFYGSCLEEPVYNRSGDVLYYYPDLPQETFTVPTGVKRLARGAFGRNKKLKEVIIPEGLERIENMTFCETNLQEITIPASVKFVAAEAFYDCPMLKKLDIRCDLSALKPGIFNYCPQVQVTINGEEPDFEQDLHIRGISLMQVPRSLHVPEDYYRDRRIFWNFTQRLAEGDTQAMMEFADYLERQGTEEFYECAVNFWRYRAFLYGNPEAAAWKEAWMQAHPRQRIPTVMDPDLKGDYHGDQLRALGFLFFDPERSYTLEGVDNNGIVEISSWCDELPADEDGFGRENLYDWWYLDENLTRIPGICYLGCRSWADRARAKKVFADAYQNAVAAVKQKKQRKNQTDGSRVE